MRRRSVIRLLTLIILCLDLLDRACKRPFQQGNLRLLADKGIIERRNCVVLKGESRFQAIYTLL